MSSSIWKAVLQTVDVQEIEVPEGAEILTVREQFEQPCVWFKCDPSKPVTKRRIGICGTGHPAPEDARYVGTCHLMGGSLVLHVFERPQP